MHFERQPTYNTWNDKHEGVVRDGDNLFRFLCSLEEKTVVAIYRLVRESLRDREYWKEVPRNRTKPTSRFNQVAVKIEALL